MVKRERERERGIGYTDELFTSNTLLLVPSCLVNLGMYILAFLQRLFYIFISYKGQIFIYANSGGFNSGWFREWLDVEQKK